MWARSLGFAVLVWIPGLLAGPTSCSGSTKGDDKLLFTTIDKCGAFPVVQDADFEPVGQFLLKYKCANLSQLQGPELVVCYSNSSWSELPYCRANYCTVNTNDYPDLQNVGVRHIKAGDTERLDCEDKWTFRNYALVECDDKAPRISHCCNKVQINTGVCWARGLMTD